MPGATAITFDALESALQWSSSSAAYENEAFISRTTGEVYFKSTAEEFDSEIPEDLEDGPRYAAVPHKNELGLGRRLVLAFVKSAAPAHVRTVEGFFRKRGAYAKFKALAEGQGLLEKWYEFEAAATRAELERWAVENGFSIVQGSSDA